MIERLSNKRRSKEACVKASWYSLWADSPSPRAGIREVLMSQKNLLALFPSWAGGCSVSFSAAGLWGSFPVSQKTDEAGTGTVQWTRLRGIHPHTPQPRQAGRGFVAQYQCLPLFLSSWGNGWTRQPLMTSNLINETMELGTKYYSWLND